MNLYTQPFRVVFIGAGNLATHLAYELFDTGYDVVQVYSRTATSAKALADRIEAEWVTELHEVTTDAELYFVCLNDAAFMELLPQIVAGKDGKLLVHTAGSIPMSIWEGMTDRYGVFYPFQTFSKQRRVFDFLDIPIYIEAAREEDAELLKEIGSTMSEYVYEANSLVRKNLHLAAVFACNFTNHLYVLAAELMKKYHLPFKVMLPLIDETAMKVHDLSPHKAQTGPAVRGDEAVIQEHLKMLADEPKMREVYEMLTKSIELVKSE